MSDTLTAPRRGLTGTALKLIAVVTMFLDHIGAAILESTAIWVILDDAAETTIDYFFNSSALEVIRNADVILRAIGRVSFPIFCFLLVEGFLHTKNLRKYFLRLGVFALLSEVPFDLAFAEYWYDPYAQNIFFTLLLGLLAMTCLSRFGDRSLPGLLLALGCIGLGELFRVDYGGVGVALIVLLYLLRDRKVLQTVAGCVALSWEVTAPLAFIPIRLYNGERGRSLPKYFFYAFYPLHILLLCLVREVMLRWS